MSPLLRRTGALVASSVLAVTGVTLVSTPAQAVGTDPRPLSIGADWLAGELVDGLLRGDGGATLYGPSIDAALALKLAGGHAADVQAVGDGLADALDSYIDFSYTFDSDGDEVDETYTGEAAGPTAKALVLAQNLAVPTTTLGGVDLLARVEGYVAPEAPIAGRLVGVALKDGDPDPFGEYTNVIGQALGAAALHTAGSEEAGAALDFLLQQQCAAGYFRLDFNFDKTALDQTCDGADPSSPADPDVTAQVVRLLQPQAAGNATVEAALEKAEDWLIARQRPDGSFIGGVNTAVPNANSTGLIGSALGLRGETAAATKAAVWLRAHQADELASCPNALSTETGAIAYGDRELAAGRASGIDSSAQQWRIAATQALPALVHAPAAVRALKISGPTTVKARSVVVYTVSGVVPGDKVCVSGLGLLKPAAAGSTGTARVAFTMPSASSIRTFSVRDRAGNNAALQVQVLGAKTLGVAVPSTVKRGATVPVTVTGLAPGESVRITVDGVKVRTGFANTKGVFTSSFKASTVLGTDVVRAFGKYADIRKGYDILKVVA